MIARVLNYRDRDVVLRLAREKGVIQYQRNATAFFPDFTLALQQARKEFALAKKKLQNLRISYTMMYPVKLCIEYRGKTKILTTPQAAHAYIKTLASPRRDHASPEAEDPGD
ncbi:hypothetical protein NDU88_005200 [Pleurodeles waltl]|uniref:Uncharacterized protein n=1 Tax=Pleurodeles waltl TaxID=8319 RepID=A0AAV7L3R7_PLEWA|nr:hypothetical protein NDU88_005200 [Pleurodeles waltl]